MQYYALIFAAATLWGAAPLVGRMSGIGGLPMALCVAFGSLLACMPIMMRGGNEALLSKGGAIATGAGILNGLGLLAFYVLVAGAADGKWEISRSLPIVYAAVPIIIALGAAVFFGESMTTAKWFGIALMATGFWFLK